MIGWESVVVLSNAVVLSNVVSLAYTGGVVLGTACTNVHILHL